MGGRGRLVVVVGLATLASLLAAATGAAAPVGPPAMSSVLPPGCVPGPQPFRDVPGADLRSEAHLSSDDDPVPYVMWRGTVPSFDGLPLSVDLTLPCGPEAPAPTARPTIAMLHGFTDDKTVWEETGKSDTVESTDRPGANSRWNNIWFASRGYATLTYTARGWHDSCGPQAEGASAGTPAPQCADHQYWIHLDDKRWEVRDVQWLMAGLVQDGVADANRLAITGGSYGGAPTASAALLDDQVMCGADPMPEALGPDPCAGKGDGELVRWTTPDGNTTLSWAAALPLYTFSDLLRVLAPNGRWTDGAVDVPKGESSTEPFGVPLQSTVSGLLLAGQAFGAFAPKGSDPDSDVLTTTDRLLAGDPYEPDDPIVQQGIEVYERYKSPITTAPQGAVPMFLVQGFTDALFPASEAVAMVEHLRAADPDYPVKAFFGDIGHDYAAERQDDWDLVKDQMNAFVDHYLDPERTPTAPVFDVGASVTRCLPADAAQTYVVESSWADLHDGTASFTSDDEGGTSTAKAGPAGAATDPISTATLPGAKSYKGCRIVRPSTTDPTTATYEFDVNRDVLLLGAPVVDLQVATTGPDAPVAVRLWDVAPDGSAQALITRGVYRMGAAAPDGTTIRFQLSPQAYDLPKGHHLKAEVTANDAPYLLADNQPSDVTVSRIRLDLPTRSADAQKPTREADEEPVDAPPSDSVPDWIWLVVVGGVLAVIGVGIAVTRRRRR